MLSPSQVMMLSKFLWCLKIETGRYSETLIKLYQIIRLHNPDDSNLYTQGPPKKLYTHRPITNSDTSAIRQGGSGIHVTSTIFWENIALHIVYYISVELQKYR
jgi:hypothetical protein